MPQPYMDMLLCERFGWSPSELDDINAELVAEFLVMWSVEQEVAKAEGKLKGSKTGSNDA